MTNVQRFPFKRVVLLGHTGYIGSRLAAHFRKSAPDVEIVGRSLPATDLSKPDGAHGLADVLSGDAAVVLLSAVKRQSGDSLAAFQTNMNIAINVAAALEKHPVGHFTFFSSAAVYGEDVPNTRITEEAPIVPRSYYGLAKFVSEGIFQKALSSTDLLFLRPPLVYGPDEAETFYSPSGFAKTALAGGPVTMWGDGTELREFLYCDDLVEIVFQLLARRKTGVVNVAGGGSRTFADAVAVLSKLTGKNIAVDSRPRTKNKVDNVFSPGALARHLPDFKFTSLEDGLRKIVDLHSVAGRPRA